MQLEEINIGNEVKYECNECKGTGIHKGWAEGDDLGTVCPSCNGAGYKILKINNNIKLIQDINTKTIYVGDNNTILGVFNPFNEIKKRKDVNYVAYATGKYLTPNFLFKRGIDETNIIKYEDFLKGKLPLPIMHTTCPKEFVLIYGDVSFDNECPNTNYCSKYGTTECWDKFYENKKTSEEKQKILKRIRRN